MKKYLIFAAIFLLAVSCGKQLPPEEPNPTPNPDADLNTYVSPTKYGFSIKYSDDFGFDTNIEHVRGLTYIPICDEQMVACVFLTKEKYPGTNFDGAGVSINLLSDLNTESKCYNFKVATNAAQTDAGIVKINGVDFYSATGGDAGLGHFNEVKVYRNFHNNTCYEISQHIASTNVGNYPEGTIIEFNKQDVLSKLETVVKSFEFTNSQQSSVKLQVCPQEWWQNDMPTIIDTEASAQSKQYYVLDGKRRELSEFDTDWVAKNCNLTLQHAH